MAFKEIEFLKPIREFLTEYPGLQPGESLAINYLSIDPRNQNKPEGTALAFVGSSIIKKSGYIGGDIIYDEQANLMLVLRRYTNNDEFRRDIGDFTFNFIRWINYEDAMRGTDEEHPKLPRFSMTNIEEIRADNGGIAAVEIEPGVDEFHIQLHLRYQTHYQREFY